MVGVNLSKCFLTQSDDGESYGKTLLGVILTERVNGVHIKSPVNVQLVWKRNFCKGKRVFNEPPIRLGMKEHGLQNKYPTV